METLWTLFSIFLKIKTILEFKVGLRVAPRLSWPNRTLSPENWRGAQAPSDSERLGKCLQRPCPALRREKEASNVERLKSARSQAAVMQRGFHADSEWIPVSLSHTHKVRPHLLCIPVPNPIFHSLKNIFFLKLVWEGVCYFATSVSLTKPMFVV